MKVLNRFHVFKYMDCKISAVEMNMDGKENIRHFNKLNGCIERDFSTSIRKDLRQRLSRPVIKYGSGIWTMWARDKQRLKAA